MRRLFPILALVLFAGQAGLAAAADIDAGRQAAEARGCINCHNGADNPGMITPTLIPFLSGQHVAYLKRQIEAFRHRTATRSGGIKISERHNAIMEMRTANLSDAEVENIAAYYASRPCVKRTADEAPKPKPAARCAFCHGETGVTPFVAYPNLAGQKSAYLGRQLRDMREAARHVPSRNRRFHRLMAPQVLDLSNLEIEQLAEYFAAQRCY